MLGDLSLLLHFKRVELQTCVGARRNPEGRTKGGKVEWAWLFIPAYHIWEEVLTFLPHQGVLPPRPGWQQDSIWGESPNSRLQPLKLSLDSGLMEKRPRTKICLHGASSLVAKIKPDRTTQAPCSQGQKSRVPLSGRIGKAS